MQTFMACILMVSWTTAMLVCNTEKQAQKMISITGQVHHNGQPIGGVLVYVENIAVAPKVQKERPEVLVNVRNGKMERSFIAMSVQQKLTISWEKNELHDIVIHSKQRKFGANVPKPGNRITFVFEDPEKVCAISCNLNPKLTGHLTILPNENYTFSKDDGTFVIPPMIAPTSNFTVVAFRPGDGWKKQDYDPKKNAGYVFKFN